MLEFTCQSCGKRVQGDETLAGQSVQCPACNAAMTFPHTAQTARPLAKTPAAVDAAISEGPPPRAETPPIRDKMPHLLSRWSGFLVLGAMTLVALFLLIPYLLKMREAALRTESTNHLKAIGLAFHSFHDANRRLPYNGTVNPYKFNRMQIGGPAIGGDGATGSWAFMILPFLDQQALFNTKDPTKGVAVFMCPGRGRPMVCTGDAPGAWTDYFLNSFINDPNGNPDAPDRRRTLVGITDGTSWSVLAGHGQIMPADYSATDAIPGYTDSIFNGGSASLCRPNRAVSSRRDSEDSVAGDWGGPFPQGWLLTMCDGRVLMFPHGMSGGTITNGVCDMKGGNSLGGYITPDGGEAVVMGD